jgi:hypothetical protein
VDCLNCGLLDKSENNNYCLRFKKNVTQEMVGQACLYFKRIIYEEGEPLSARQHLILQDQELRSKKMQGPIK